MAIIITQKAKHREISQEPEEATEEEPVQALSMGISQYLTCALLPLLKDDSTLFRAIC